MNKKMLKDVKNAIANVLELTDNWSDGTYFYHLTRVKSAFDIGTMTMDDFEEVDEDLVEDIFESILPYLDQCNQHTQELEKEMEQEYSNHKDLESSLMQQNKKYQEALEHIKEHSDDKVAVFIARKTLERAQ